jgi:hypothetical protein
MTQGFNPLDPLGLMNEPTLRTILPGGKVRESDIIELRVLITGAASRISTAKGHIASTQGIIDQEPGNAAGLVNLSKMLDSINIFLDQASPIVEQAVAATQSALAQVRALETN